MHSFKIYLTLKTIITQHLFLATVGIKFIIFPYCDDIDAVACVFADTCFFIYNSIIMFSDSETGNEALTLNYGWE